MSNDRKEEEMICALTADEHVALQEGLRGLPETMPPREVWLKIREQGEAEGLLTQRGARRHNRWYGGVGLAAAAVMAAVMMPGTQLDTTPANVVPQELPTNSADISNLARLQSYSRKLESDLRALSEIEDRVAAIDYQLNDPSVQMTDGDREIFWRERVRLMKLLLQLRYAQAQRAAF